MKKDNKRPNKKETMYPDTLETLKLNIRKVRKKGGYSSAQKLADDLGVSLKTVQGWENLDNNRWPDLVMMIHFCETTGCDLDYLLGRLDAPTHETEFIHEQTGLSIEAVENLIKLKGSGFDGLLSEIITHRNAPRLLRVLQLASDEDEVSWLELDQLPRGLSSSYSEKPIDFSSGIGSEVADFLASQELTGITRDIREAREKERQASKWGTVSHQYNVYNEKNERARILEELEQEIDDLESGIEYLSDPNEFEAAEYEIERRQQKLEALQKLMSRIRNTSFMEWKCGDVQREYKTIIGEEKNDGQH